MVDLPHRLQPGLGACGRRLMTALLGSPAPMAHDQLPLTATSTYAPLLSLCFYTMPTSTWHPKKWLKTIKCLNLKVGFLKKKKKKNRLNQLRANSIKSLLLPAAAALLAPPVAAPASPPGCPRCLPPFHGAPAPSAAAGLRHPPRPAAGRPSRSLPQADTYEEQGKEAPGHAAAAHRCPAKWKRPVPPPAACALPTPGSSHVGKHGQARPREAAPSRPARGCPRCRETTPGRGFCLRVILRARDRQFCPLAAPCSLCWAPLCDRAAGARRLLLGIVGTTLSTGILSVWDEWSRVHLLAVCECRARLWGHKAKATDFRLCMRHSLSVLRLLSKANASLSRTETPVLPYW